MAFVSPSQWDSPWLHSLSDAPQQAAALETPLNYQTEDFRWVFETPGNTFCINQQTLSTPIHHNHGQKDKTPRTGPHSTHRSAKKKKMKHKKTDNVYPFFPQRLSLILCVLQVSSYILIILKLLLILHRQEEAAGMRAAKDVCSYGPSTGVTRYWKHLAS